MQPIEHAFQEFKRRHGNHLDAAAAQYGREAHAFGEDAERVALSLRGALRYLGVQSAEGPLLAASRRADELQVWLAYRATKQIFTIEEPLADALSAATWPEDLPTDALFLPVNGAVLRLRLPSEESRSDFVCFQDYGADGTLLLRVARVSLGGPLAACGLLRMGKAPLQATLEKQRAEDEAFIQARIHEGRNGPLTQYMARELPRYKEELAVRGRLLRHLLNVILYINGNDDVVRRIHPGSKPRRERGARHRDDGDRAPEVVVVGKQFASTLEHWEIEDAQRDGEGSGGSVRPHIRRAHLHLYWTGRGRAHPKFVVVRPTMVRGGRGDQSPAVRTVT
jgi:hypothetical protein